MPSAQKVSGRDPDVLLCWGIFGMLFGAREPEMNATQLKDDVHECSSRNAVNKIIHTG